VGGAVRTSILIPYGIVTVVAAFSWQYAWTPSTGYLSSLFGDAAPLTHQTQAIATIILAEVWKTTPFMALLLMAGLALVPEDLQKAAKVNPDSVDAHMYLANVYAQLKQTSEAEKERALVERLKSAPSE